MCVRPAPAAAAGFHINNVSVLRILRFKEEKHHEKRKIDESGSVWYVLRLSSDSLRFIGRYTGNIAGCSFRHNS